MKIYIVQEVTGITGEIDTHNHLAFFSKEKAQEYIDYVSLFIPDLDHSTSDGYIRSCCYELCKLGHMYDWKDVWDDQIPSFLIDEVGVAKYNKGVRNVPTR